jgi:hypothetical protein
MDKTADKMANKMMTLALNKHWLAHSYKTVKDAIISVTGSESKPSPTALAVDIEYHVDEKTGIPDFDNYIGMRPLTWSEWIKLPIKPWHLTINGALRPYRVPTVIIDVNFDKVILKNFNKRPSNAQILERDGYTCQYTGKKLRKDQLNVDHVIPKDRGGEDTWENMVASEKSLNSKKGNRLNSEIGLKLIRQPTMPHTIPFMALIMEARHNDWRPFINKK